MSAVTFGAFAVVRFGSFFVIELSKIASHAVSFDILWLVAISQRGFLVLALILNLPLLPVVIPYIKKDVTSICERASISARGPSG